MDADIRTFLTIRSYFEVDDFELEWTYKKVNTQLCAYTYSKEWSACVLTELWWALKSV